MTVNLFISILLTISADSKLLLSFDNLAAVTDPRILWHQQVKLYKIFLKLDLNGKFGRLVYGAYS